MSSPLPVALLFPGQGAQHPRMAAGLYGHREVFTETMDEAFDLLDEYGESLREQWLAVDPATDFDDVTVAQPLLYSVGYALGREVLSWGVEPAGLLGHSVGEMVAATVAGVFEFADGMRLMQARMREFVSAPAGGMLAVAASAAEVEPVLDGHVHIAAVNAPRQLLLSGLSDPLADAAEMLRGKGLICIEVRAKQPFHSPAVEQASASSGRLWTDTVLKPPRFPVYSAYTEEKITVEQACNHKFWTMQPAETVFFSSTLDRMLADSDFALVEAGPGAGLSTLARRHPSVLAGRSAVIPMLPDRPRGDEHDRRAVSAAAERIHLLRTGGAA
jgi:acyl transferase domain-containing protein